MTKLVCIFSIPPSCMYSLFAVILGGDSAHHTRTKQAPEAGWLQARVRKADLSKWHGKGKLTCGVRHCGNDLSQALFCLRSPRHFIYKAFPLRNISTRPVDSCELPRKTICPYFLQLHVFCCPLFLLLVCSMACTYSALRLDASFGTNQLLGGWVGVFSL